MMAVKIDHLVCVEISLGEGRFEWQLAFLLRESRGGYFVKVPFLGDSRAEFPPPKKRKKFWQLKRKGVQKEDTNDDEYEWSGFVFFPSSPLSVLFARISSRSFLDHLVAMEAAGKLTGTEYWIELTRICEADPEKLFRKINWQKYRNA